MGVSVESCRCALGPQRHGDLIVSDAGGGPGRGQSTDCGQMQKQVPVATDISFTIVGHLSCKFVKSRLIFFFYRIITGTFHLINGLNDYQYRI